MKKVEWARKTKNNDINNSKNHHVYFTPLKSLNSTGKKLKKWLPCDKTLTNIETKFGGSFVSLFELNRWLFIINFIISILVGIFIIAPQYAYNLDETNDVLEFNKNQSNFSAICNKIAIEENNENKTTFNSNSTIEEAILYSKCCFYNYTKYLKQNQYNKTNVDVILDVFQGTGIFEESFFFYGQYSNKTTLNVQKKHTYYMGLSFASITLFSLIISAIGMLIRLGKGLETSIINRIEAISMISQSFVSWDYNLKDEKNIELTKSIIYRFYQNEINQIKYNEKMKSLILKEKLIIHFKRIFFHLITIIMFIVGGIALYYLNEFTFELKRKDINKYLLWIVEYLPALAINLIIFVYPAIFNIFKKFEDYSDNFKINLFLLRTGFTRIASILFIIVNLSINIVRNENVCATQSSKLVGELLSFDFSIQKKTEIWCWETYVGQEFYKLVMIDLILKLLSFLLIIFRFIFSKSFNLISKSEFNLESSFFELMNAQTLFWIGLYFSPFLAIIAPFYFIIKFYLTLYILKYFTEIDSKNRQMKLNTSFFLVLFVVFLLVLILFGFIFTTLKPSRSCGPFRIQYSPMNDFTVVSELQNQLQISLPSILFSIIEYIFSTFFMIILTFILIGIIMIIWTISRSQKEITREYLKILQNQDPLKRNRTTEAIHF